MLLATRTLTLLAAPTLVLAAAGIADPLDSAPESASRRRVPAHRVNPHPPKLDGRLDDPVWKDAYFVTGFTAKRPDEGLPASLATHCAVVYDDDAIYVGARMACDPDDIVASVTRRDNVGNSEQLLVSFDSYNDKRTAYTFGVTPTGVRVDYYHPQDSEGSADRSFDPVWEARAHVGPDGWTAEMRIPFSQLRFNRQQQQSWGVNFNRWIPHTNEDVYWVMVPNAETGWASRFGELHGMESIAPPRRLELTPYYANDARFTGDADPDDPFDNGRNLATRFGADVKMGLGPNLTLEGTINPDFGQVEADPAEVNLSAFETFFSERRPFFTEGSRLLEGDGPSYFYSRRIGASPRGNADGDFVERPDNTTIISAAKLSGRLANGTSLAVLTAVTARENARVFDSATDTESEVEVEPLTGYGVLRTQQEIGANKSTVGLSLTAVGRDIGPGDPLDEVVNRGAVTGGTDWNLRFREGDYVVGGHLGFSHVRGSQQRIEDLQRNSAHYFQRPDQDHVAVDPGRTSLNGYAASLWGSKNGGKHWLWEGGFNAESPGFELNDAGRLSSADDISTWANLRYRENDRGPLFRDYFMGLFVNNGWNFGGIRQQSSAALFAEATWPNFWHSWVEYDAWARVESDASTRGGPLMGRGWGHEIEAGINNNFASNTAWNAHSFYWTNELGGWGWGLSGGLEWKPAPRVHVAVDPRFQRNISERQYVDTIEGGGAATFGSRYLFASLDQTTISSQLRINYTFTPDLSVEVYAEPFAASGGYSRFGELAAAGSRDLRVYGSDGTAIVEDEAGAFTVTDGADRFTFERSDFRFTSFRSNLVIRWEWSPGSTLFLVWQQNRSAFDAIDQRVRARSLWDALSAAGDNILAVKVSTWLPID